MSLEEAIFVFRREHETEREIFSSERGVGFMYTLSRRVRGVSRRIEAYRGGRRGACRARRANAHAVTCEVGSSAAFLFLIAAGALSGLTFSASFAEDCAVSHAAWTSS